MASRDDRDFFEKDIYEGEKSTKLEAIANISLEEARTIYIRNQYLSLSEMITETFPKFFKRIGEEQFNKLVKEYLINDKSKDWDIFAICQRFAPFINLKSSVSKDLQDICNIESIINKVFFSPFPGDQSSQQILTNDSILMSNPSGFFYEAPVSVAQEFIIDTLSLEYSGLHIFKSSDNSINIAPVSLHVLSLLMALKEPTQLEEVLNLVDSDQRELFTKLIEQLIQEEQIAIKPN